MKKKLILKKKLMATYKRRGYKKSITSSKEDNFVEESKTAEVFEKLDDTASKTEKWVSKYQNIILGIIGAAIFSVLSYLGYNKFIFEPKAKEAISELNQAQIYFDLALNSVQSDSLFLRSLNGGEGKYGFLDIIENYSNTPAAKLAIYSAGMAYLNLKDYNNAIYYLDQFEGDDILLSALSKGSIGDAFVEIGQLDDAFDYYIQASKVNENLFSTPKYLYKAAITASKIGKINQSIDLLKKIKKDFPESEQSDYVEVQIGRLETSLK